SFFFGYPRNGGGDCLAMDTFTSSGEWLNMDCATKFPVVCARKSEPRPVCAPGPWKEGDVIYSPGYPYDASTPCDYFLTVDAGKRVEVEVLLLESNSCCDRLVMEDDVLGGNIVANMTGELTDVVFTTKNSNLMRVSWQPNGGVNVRGMMVQFAHSSCPEGYELVREGECRGQQTIILNSSFKNGAREVIQKCAEIQGQPPIIHNDEHQSYWMKQAPFQSKGYLILGLVCNSDSQRWGWADGSSLEDYRPPGGYNRGKNDRLPGSWSLLILANTGSVFSSSEGLILGSVASYIHTQLRQPTGDGCDTFADDSDDGMCYEVLETASSWNESLRSCENLGSTIASIHNAQENAFIRRLAVASGAVNGVYLGATRTGDAFVWNDGSAWDYDNFYPGFPNAGLGDYLAMDTFSSTGEWMNMDSSSQLAVVCARPANPRPICSTGPWKEGEVIYSPGYPYDASVPCDYLLSVYEGKNVQVEVQLLEANTCCDRLMLEDRMLGGNIVANMSALLLLEIPYFSLTGEISGTTFTTQSSNFMRVSWQPNGGVNVRDHIPRSVV
ncbi:hypothetical protein PENTCL1PPCAC_10543, partial [Pristionchus entomophagus]